MYDPLQCELENAKDYYEARIAEHRTDLIGKMLIERIKKEIQELENAYTKQRSQSHEFSCAYRARRNFRENLLRLQDLSYRGVCTLFKMAKAAPRKKEIFAK